MPATENDADPRQLEDVPGRIERALVAADDDDATGRALRGLGVTLIVATDGEEAAVRFGPDGIEAVAPDAEGDGPRVRLRGDAAVLDRVWRGALTPAEAIGLEQLAAEGAVNHLLRVCVAIPKVAAGYRRLVRRDLADAPRLAVPATA